MKAFVFPGQGAQYPGMGKDLYDKVPLASGYVRERQCAARLPDHRYNV